LTVSDILLITLKYYREYVTMESIADGRFPLPGKKTLQDDESTIESCPGGEL
jgi:hypothetical protein